MKLNFTVGLIHIQTQNLKPVKPVFRDSRSERWRTASGTLGVFLNTGTLI